MRSGLVLLGRWAETPLIAYPGYCDRAQSAFEAITGHRLEPFTLLRQGLHEQYFLDSSVKSTESWLRNLPDDARDSSVDRIFNFYYMAASDLAEQFTVPLTMTNISRLSDTDLLTWIERWIDLPSRLAGPIFFSVLLDLWTEAGFIQSDRNIDVAASARDHCSNVYDIQAKREAQRLFEEVAIRLGCTWGDLQMLFPEEIVAWLESGTSGATSIARRREFYVTRNVAGSYKCLEGEQAEASVSDVQLASLGTPRDSLVGLVAFAGKLSGRARVVLSPEDSIHLIDGEIIVAYQTSVWYEPLFDHAAAVLTELGGATSHAAVVCAERGLTCIVSIEDLIQSVSNGDWLSIDTNQGSIEIRRNYSGTGLDE